MLVYVSACVYVGDWTTVTALFLCTVLCVCTYIQ